jgi:ABC-2 type transport system permease protein
MSLLVPVFGGVLAYHWATDLDHGRLELTLSTPPPRWRVVLERYGAVLASAVIATVVVWLTVVVCAQLAGFAVDEGRVAEASFGLLPLALITASLVYALAGLVAPGVVIGIMTAFLAISYLSDLLQAFLKLPSWVLKLSMYQQYGAPLLNGLSWGAFAVMLGVALVLLALGVWQFSARDVEVGAS